MTDLSPLVNLDAMDRLDADSNAVTDFPLGVLLRSTLTSEVCVKREASRLHPIYAPMTVSAGQLPEFGPYQRP